MAKKWTNWVIPGLMAVSHLSAAAEVNIIDDVLSDPDSLIETEVHEQSLQDTLPAEETGPEENTSIQQDVPKTRFGVGYEYRQSLRPEIFERPDLPARPQRPERPDMPGRFGQ